MATAPTPPQITVRPVATSGALEFFWAAPTSDGGSAITGYTLSCSGLSSQSVGASTYNYRYTGLTNGTSYTFSITADNAIGSSTPAVFRTVQPGNKPGPVQSLTVTRTNATTATLNWTAPSSDGGAALIGYLVQAVNTDPAVAAIKQSVLPSATSATVSSLVNGDVYRFKVQAINDPGYGPEVVSNPTSMTATWYQSPLTSDIANYWSSVSCDISGEKLIATAGGISGIYAPIYQSFDRGATWKQIQSAAAIDMPRASAISRDSRRIAVATFGTTGIYISDDYGVTWRLVTASQQWVNLSCSEDGRVLPIHGNNSQLYTIAPGESSLTSVSPATSTFWRSGYLSPDGQLWVIGSDGSPSALNISTDGGTNWTNRSTELGVSSTAISGIAVSSDKLKMVVMTESGIIKRSTDGGANWTTLTTLSTSGTQLPNTLACSTDGSIIYAINSRTIWVSLDSGTTWRRRMSFPIRGTGPASGWIYDISCSADGRVAYASQYNNKIWCSQDYGSNWFMLQSPAQIQGYASCMSSDGNVQYIADFSVGTGFIWKSINKGVSWSRLNPNATDGGRAWRWICCSADGTVVAATETSLVSTGAGYIWISTDSGATFTRQDAAGLRNWRGICCDISGSKLAACVGTTSTGNIYTADLSGSYPADLSGSNYIWTAQTGAGGRAWRAISCNADRTKLVACAGVFNDNIYTSTDSGVNWTSQTGAGARNWLNVVCTPDFTKMIASISPNGSNPGTVHISTDSGVTWNTAPGLPTGLTNAQYTYAGLAISSDGTKMATGNLSTGMWVSTDSGASWAQETKVQGTSLYSVSMSADGSIITAPVNGGLGPITKQLLG